MPRVHTINGPLPFPSLGTWAFGETRPKIPAAGFIGLIVIVGGLAWWFTSRK